MDYITLTQYVRPDGRQREISFETTPKLAEQVRLCQENSFEFCLEKLPEGGVVFYISDSELETDLATKILPENTELPTLYQLWLERYPLPVLLEKRSLYQERETYGNHKNAHKSTD